MYSHEIKPHLKRVLGKLSRKDKALYEQVIKKINEVISGSDVEHYKNLRHDLSSLKRVQIGHFVLVFSFDKFSNLISFEDFDHHDNIYKR
jgi:mRNA-degrading endonuclease RelE of RelBE toxin-antitoxin system